MTSTQKQIIINLTLFKVYDYTHSRYYDCGSIEYDYTPLFGMIIRSF